MKKFLVLVALAMLLIAPTTQANAAAVEKIGPLDNVQIQPTSWSIQVMWDIDFLALRTAPTVNSRLLWRIPPGTRLEAYDSSNGWLYTQYRGSWGWVSSRYVY